MLSHKIINILVMLFLIISPLFAGGSQALTQAAQVSGGQQTLKGPYPNDTIGGTNSGTGQMRTTTKAMREAAAYQNQNKQQKGVSQNYAGIDKYNGLASPLGYNPNAALTPAALLPLGQPDYFGVANWALSPLPQIDPATGQVLAGTGIRKFVDTLAGLCDPTTTMVLNTLGQCLPKAIPDTATFPGSDYYEIALVQYTQKLSTDLPPTLIRGYVQVLTPALALANPSIVAVPLSNTASPDGGVTWVSTPILDSFSAVVNGTSKPQYLGPVIVASGCDSAATPPCTPRPVRVKFTNYLPTGAGGDLQIPTDTTYMGAGMGPGGSINAITVTAPGTGYTSSPAVTLSLPPTGGVRATAVANINNGSVVSFTITNGGTLYTTAPTVTLTGGGFTMAATATSVLDGLTGNMYSQNRATLHLHGGNTPWISDGTPHQWTVPAGEITSYSRGDSVAFVPDMCFSTTNGAASYRGTAATCPTGTSNDPGPGSLDFYWTNQQSGRMMFYHDHSYGITRLNVYAGEAAGYLLADPNVEAALAALKVPGTISTTPDLAHMIPLVIQDKTFVPDTAQLAVQDPTWSVTKYGGKGALWFPHVYMPNQNPADVTGANAFGRWDYGPWFFPPQNSSTFVADGQPYNCTSSFYGTGGPAFPPLVCPGTPNPSGVPEGFMDTPVVNGTAYPTLTVDPTAYRIQLLNAGNDRTLNLGLYVAEPLSVAVTNAGTGYTPGASTTVTFTGGSGGPATATATVSTGTVVSVLLTGVGSGYSTVPNVTITGDGTGATAAAVIDPITGTVTAVNIINGGTGYTAATVAIDPPAGCATGCTTATAIASVLGAGAILSISVTQGTTPWTVAPTVTIGGTGTGATAIASINSEVKMVPAVPPMTGSVLQPCSAANPTGGAQLVSALLDGTGNPLNGTGLMANCWPSAWPTDGRDGGVPDPTKAGPPIIQIGAEGGLLPAPVIIPSTPVGYEYNRRSITVLNVFTHGLLVGPAERADLIVDFSKYAGQTLIVYNDAPAPVPAFDPRNDYYTGDPDQTSSGGAPTTLPGYGPNTRTVMQIKVNATTPTAFNVAPLAAPTGIPAAFATTQPKIIVPEAVYPATNGGGANTYVRIQDNTISSWIGGQVGSLTMTSGGAGYTAAPTVGFTGGGGINAAATANLAGTVVASVTKGSGGTGYTSAPTVTFAGGGGTGAAATATLSTTTVASVTVTNQGNGYTTLPTVTFSAPPPGGTTAAGTPTVVNRRVTAITVTNPGAGYVTAPTVTISGGGGSGARATATLAPKSVATVTLTNPGSGYTSAPTVGFLGGGGTGATATAALVPTSVASITLTNGGTGYTGAPTVTLSAPQTTGSTATAIANPPVTNLLPKTIQELFTLDFGRMNATLGVELPFTNFLTQTTIPYGYVDPPTEIFQDGETQLWKITHNGVDTHFIHFHLFTVQVINRVGWDGAIKPPDGNEVGWKDTVRMNPLEDIVVALRPMKQQNLPWQLPLSIRPLDVTESIGSSTANQFTNVDPTNQPATVTNDLTNFGYEYVWHCHILGHEENDMMRAMVLGVAPVAPSNLSITKSTGTRAVKLSWTDNSINESGFTIQRSITAPPNAFWVTVGTGPANPGSGNTATFVDTTVNKNTNYWYQVLADNLVGYTKAYAAPAAGYPSLDVPSGPSNVFTVMTNGSNNVTPFTGSPFLFASGFQAVQPLWSGTVGVVKTDKAAAMSISGGTAGMEAVISGDALQGSFVFDHSPAGTLTYDASFYFNPNGAVSGLNPIDIFVGLDQNGQQAFGIQYRQVLIESEPHYQVRGWVQQNGNQAESNWVDIANSANTLELAWTSDVNGGLSLFVNDFLAQTLTGDTSGHQLLDAMLGPSGGLAGASGTMYFDEFTSSTVIGLEYSLYVPQLFVP